MMRAEVCDLITVSPEAAGVGTDPAETRRTVFCTLKSIGQQEAYQAMGQGLNPELKVVLAHDFEYQGERLCEIEGVMYNILRTYLTETDGIELTCQRVTGNARAAIDAEAEAILAERKAQEQREKAQFEELKQLLAANDATIGDLISSLKGEGVG